MNIHEPKGAAGGCWASPPGRTCKKNLKKKIKNKKKIYKKIYKKISKISKIKKKCKNIKYFY